MAEMIQVTKRGAHDVTIIENCDVNDEVDGHYILDDGYVEYSFISEEGRLFKIDGITGEHVELPGKWRMHD